MSVIGCMRALFAGGWGGCGVSCWSCAYYRGKHEMDHGAVKEGHCQGLLSQGETVGAISVSLLRDFPIAMVLCRCYMTILQW